MRFASANLAVTWWYEIFLPKIGLSAIAKRTRNKRMQRIAQRFYVLAVDLGGLMIKVGQYMSSRLDVLPPEITAELEGLQDEVPAVEFSAIRALAEQELGSTLEEAFLSVDETPVAAASLGQTYRARLTPTVAEQSGLDTVVIKIQRPDIEKIIQVDLTALRKVAGWLSKIRLISKRMDIHALVEEFAVTSLEEIDYLQEAANAERYAENYAAEPRVTVPAIVWERTTKRLLTLEDVTAIKINDLDALKAAGIDPNDVAIVLAEVMFDQFFTHAYFHADPHPGNIFVTPTLHPLSDHEPPWKLTFIDFGMMGEVPVNTQTGLRKLLIAAATRDGKGLVAAVQELGVLLPFADTEELERAVTKLFARFGGMGFAELREVDPREFHDFIVEFGDMVRTMPFQLPENFLLIIRSTSLTSGVCSTLNPEFNLWDSVEPYAARMLRDQGMNMAQDVMDQAKDIFKILVRLPKRLDALILEIERGGLSVKTPALNRRIRQLERTTRRQIGALIFSGLLISGTILRAQDELLGTVMMGTALLPLIYAVFAPRN